MATVYLVASLGPDDFRKLVVIKELMPALCDDANFVRMFRTEARLAARLQHQNVVQTYDAWQLEGQLFLTMEFLDGQPLHSVVARLGQGSLGLPASLYVLRSTLAALHYAHELCDYDGTPLGIVHRDVSPQNVFLTYDGQVKLVDFGIAKIAGAATTEVGTFKGKANYAAPEQVLGGQVDRRADVFAAGVMLWEALTGRSICEPGREQASALLGRLQGREPGVLEVNPQADPTLAAICARAMAFEPSARFAGAKEFREALEAHPLGAPTPTVSAELGMLLASAFAAERKAVQAHIEAVMRLPTQGQLEPVAAPAPAAAPVSVAAPEVAMPSAGWLSSQPSVSKTSLPPPVSSAARALVMAGALLVVGVGAAMGRQALGPSASRAGEALMVATSGAATTDGAAAGVVTVTIRAAPEHATIFIDGTHIHANPVRFSALPDGQPHRVRAEAEGFVVEERLVTLERDSDIMLRLVPIGEYAGSSNAGSDATSPSAARAKPAAPPPSTTVRRLGTRRDIDDDPYRP
ncbi:MAG: protein kinase [Polyangiaceae bacterium]|jgi:serine/threonine-protein kinase|nr:protein kinase [Polyangiaceae bacterium]